MRAESLQQESQQQDDAVFAESRILEDRTLKAGYAAMLWKRYPFLGDYFECDDPESAYFLYMEKTYSEIPDELRYDNLKAHIHQDHQDRIYRIYQGVLRQRNQYISSIKNLSSHWEEVPPLIEDNEADTTIEDLSIKIQEKFRETLKAIITSSKHDDIQKWQLQEKTLRETFNKIQKNYRTALRIYYEMLLEQSPDKRESVLDINCPLRQKSAESNRGLSVLAAAYQGIFTAKKAHHHDQKEEKRRTRKTEKVPFVTHPIDVTGGTLLDVVPHIINNQRIQINLTLLAIIAPNHDLYEDTTLNEKEIIARLKENLDTYDSEISASIQSGFNRSREYMKKSVLDLLKTTNTHLLKQIIRILSKNYKLSDKMKKRGIISNIAEPELTQELLEVTPEEIKRWRIKNTQTKTPSKTFQSLKKPGPYEWKTAKFLIRMNAISESKKAHQYALQIKCEDQSDNLMQMNGWPTEKKLETIRRNMLLAKWIMLDHDNTKYPLYDALPRLIKTMFSEYIKLKENLEEEYKEEKCSKEKYEELKNNLESEGEADIQQLQNWYQELLNNRLVYPLPPEIQNIINAQQNGANAAIHPLYGTSVSQPSAEI